MFKESLRQRINEAVRNSGLPDISWTDRDGDREMQGTWRVNGDTFRVRSMYNGGLCGVALRVPEAMPKTCDGDEMEKLNEAIRKGSGGSRFNPETCEVEDFFPVRGEIHPREVVDRLRDLRDSISRLYRDSL